MTRPSSRRPVGAVGAAALATAVVLAGCSGGDDPVVSSSPTPSSSTPSSSTPSSSTPSPTSSTLTSSAEPTASPSATASASATPSTDPTASSPTVAQVYRAARTSALSAASGRAKGSQTREGRTLRIDVEGVANGSNQTVLITTQGRTAEVLTVGDRYWLGGNEAFWVEQTGDSAAGRGMVGKYVPIAESDATELGSFTLRSILTEKFALPEFAAFESDTRPAKEADVGGRAAYLLGSAGGARLWVAADGSGALLRAVGPKSAPSDLVFSTWDRAQKFSPPPASKVVDQG